MCICVKSFSYADFAFCPVKKLPFSGFTEATRGAGEKEKIKKSPVKYRLSYIYYGEGNIFLLSAGMSFSENWQPLDFFSVSPRIRAYARFAIELGFLITQSMFAKYHFVS